MIFCIFRDVMMFHRSLHDIIPNRSCFDFICMCLFISISVLLLVRPSI